MIATGEDKRWEAGSWDSTMKIAGDAEVRGILVHLAALTVSQALAEYSDTKEAT